VSVRLRAGPTALAWPAAVVLSLALARLLSGSLPGLALTIAFLVTLVVPGLALGRLLRLGDAFDAVLLAAAAIPLGCAGWSAALMVGMIVHAPLWAVAAAGLVASCALLALLPGGSAPGLRELAGPAAAGAVLALLASRFESPLHGDALFHAGRVRKLLDLHELSLSGLSSVWHGSPHAGYVVPVLQAIDAIAAGAAGVEPSTAYPLLIPAAAALLPLAGYVLGRSGAGMLAGLAAAILLCSDAVLRGTLEAVQQPPAFAFFVLVPLTLALLLAASRAGFDSRTARVLLLAVASIAIVHATYAVVPLACIAAVVILTRRGWRLLAAAVTATAVIYAVIWAVALRGGAPGPPQPPILNSVFATWGSHPLVAQAGWMLDGRLYVAVAVLALVPLLLFYRRRHAVSAAVLAGALALCSLPAVPALLTEVFGYGQVKRLPRSGLPWALTAAIVVVELAAVTGTLRRLLPVAAGLVLASLGYQALAPEGAAATALITAIAVAATVAVVAIAVRRLPVRLNPASPAAMAAVALLAAASLAGSLRADHAYLTDTIENGPALPRSLPSVPAAVVNWCRGHDDGFPVVLAEPAIGYQLAGECDIYPLALPQERSRGELRNAPAARARSVNIALRPGASRTLRSHILDRYHVGYIVVNTASTPHAAAALAGDPRISPVLQDGDWSVYRVHA